MKPLFTSVGLLFLLTASCGDDTGIEDASIDAPLAPGDAPRDVSLPAECVAPLEFSTSADSETCTPVAYCPPGAVCGSGEVVSCDPATYFARSPIDVACTPNEGCPAPLCTIEGREVCSAECVRAAFEITDETAPTRERPWVKDRDEALVMLGRGDARTVSLLMESPAIIPPHPAHVSVPGELGAAAEFASHTVTIDGTSRGRSEAYWYSNPREPVWRSTGLYAAPGRVFTVELPDAVLGDEWTGLQVQVGSHADDELVWGFPFNQPIRRFPEVVHRVPLDDKITAMTSAFGGLIYIRVVAGTTLGPVEVKITNVTRAPIYIHGETDAASFMASLAEHPVPLAELVGDKIVLTVRTADLDGIDPAPLMDFWARAMDAVWYLAGLDDPTARIERIVADPAIQGIAHSGYPISMAELWTPALVDISDQRENQWWTTFHELGHNFQYESSTFVGLQEATCNLWALHILETVGSVPRAFTHPGEEMSDANRRTRIQGYVDGGRGFREDWQMGFNAYQGFIPLEPFMQLQEAFGWELLHDLNQAYRALPEAERPTSSEAKIQDWIVRSSMAAGVNLQGFYEDWGFPISAATSTAIGGLPAWTENPMDAFD